ncbi:hypothetical protein D3C81_298520 [compost metagenome]
MLALNKKTRRVPNGVYTVQETLELSFGQTHVFAIAAKSAEGMRDRTLLEVYTTTRQQTDLYIVTILSSAYNLN